MKTKIKHTPTPLDDWFIVNQKYGDDGRKLSGSLPVIRLIDADIIVASLGATEEQIKSYAAFFAHVMSAHELMLEALEGIREIANDNFSIPSDAYGLIKAIANDAIAKSKIAEGGK